MASCEDVDQLLTPYLDDEVEAEQGRAVAGHLQACPSCARRAAVEATARRVVMVKAAGLAARAPESLRRRCGALAVKPPARQRWVGAGWRLAGLAAASLVVIGLSGAIAYGVLTHSPTALVVGLTLDHLKCFALLEAGGEQADPAAVRSQLRADYGRTLPVPASLPRERLTLVGARRCFSTDGKVAHLLYRHDGHAVSLFMVPGSSREAGRIRVAGHVARIWSHDATTYVLLGSESEAALRPVAAYFQAARF